MWMEDQEWWSETIPEGKTPALFCSRASRMPSQQLSKAVNWWFSLLSNNSQGVEHSLHRFIGKSTAANSNRISNVCVLKPLSLVCDITPFIPWYGEFKHDNFPGTRWPQKMTRRSYVWLIISRKTKFLVCVGMPVINEATFLFFLVFF